MEVLLYKTEDLWLTSIKRIRTYLLSFFQQELED